MKKSTGLYPDLEVDDNGAGIVSQAGGIVLARMAAASGLDAGLSRVLDPWRKPNARHDPGKILTDLTLSHPTGGDCISDIDRLRTQQDIYGPMASDPTISRLIRTLATTAPAKALAAINTARAAARDRVWAAAGDDSPFHGATAKNPLMIDLDATLLTSQSEKEEASPTWKKGYGFHPLTAFVDHGPSGTGEPLAVLLRPGIAGANTVADHIEIVREALKQLPAGYRSGKRVMIRTDSAGGTHGFLDWLTASHRNLGYSVGFPIHGPVEAVLASIPDEAWSRA